MTRHIPCIQQLQDQGRPITFVQRYLRDLRPPEVAALKNAGFRIVSCFEENPSDPPLAFFTRARGQRDGWRAFAQAQAAGQPAGTPIYFALDLDPAPGQRQLVLDYFQGVKDGCRQYLADMKSQNKPGVRYAIGVYGAAACLNGARRRDSPHSSGRRLHPAGAITVRFGVTQISIPRGEIFRRDAA